jgi:hypothetical protein
MISVTLRNCSTFVFSIQIYLASESARNAPSPIMPMPEAVRTAAADVTVTSLLRPKGKRIAGEGVVVKPVSRIIGSSVASPVVKLFPA